MDLSNSQVAEHLTNIATAYEIKHKNRFQINAYKNAADTLLTYPQNLYKLWLKNPKLLDNIPNIGPSILKKINYLFTTGKPYPKLSTVFKNIHPAVFVFTKINGIGPLIAEKLTQHLKFSKDPTKALNQLIVYAQKNKIQTITTFGQKSESAILNNTLSFLGRKKRMPLKKAQRLANKIIKYLKTKFPDIPFVTLGSLRRLSPTIGDIDIAVASDKPEPILSYFINYPDSLQLISKGRNKASIRLLHDIHVDLMVKPKKSFGALLQHFTGSRQHNILLRKHALKMGFSLSEYGIKDIKTGILHKFDNEISFYNFLNLKFIPPKLRSGKNEILAHQK